MPSGGDRDPRKAGKNEMGITTREQTFATQRINMEEALEGLPVSSVRKPCKAVSQG
jgi:hypothetical protein